MNIEIGLLVLESVLLLATIMLLIYSIREGKHRNKLLAEVGKATKMLTRQEYFLTISDAMTEAKTEINGSITGRLPAGDDSKRVRQITKEVKKLARRGVRVRYLLPSFPDRLYVGHLYSKAGAEIRYSSCLMVQDLRYIAVDHNVVVLGIPESIGNKEATRKGYRIPSEGLAKLLEDNFQNCWEQGLTYDDYAKGVIQEMGASPKLLARELQMDEKELERLAGEEGDSAGPPGQQPG